MPIQVGDKIYGDKNKVKNVALELCRVASRDFRVHKSAKDFIKIRCMSINCPFQLNAVHENGTFTRAPYFKVTLLIAVAFI